MNEKLIEKKLREGVKKLGGMALKFTSPGTSGVPDRIVLMPGGKIYFVETKSTGKNLSRMQYLFSEFVKGMGFSFWCISDQEGLDQFFTYVKIYLK